MYSFSYLTRFVFVIKVFICLQDGSYSKIIPEQHEHRYNKSIFTEHQDSSKESKNGLCHKCNIVQELKVKQLACFTPTKEKYFDKEIEIFK